MSEAIHSFFGPGADIVKKLIIKKDIDKQNKSWYNKSTKRKGKGKNEKVYF